MRTRYLAYRWHSSIEALPWWKRWLHKVRYWVPIIALLVAAPAIAQVPNYRADVEACQQRYPADFLCAHTERACKADFEIRCARDIVREHGDPRLGLNWKRGIKGDLSLDIFGYRGIGPSRDIVNGGAMAVIDIIACAGGDPGVCEASVTWHVYTAAQSPIGAWVDPFSVEPSGGVVTPPTPPIPPPPQPPPATNLQPVLDAIEALAMRVEALSRELETFRITEAGRAASAEHTARDTIERIDRAHQDLLIAIDLAKQQMTTTYSGRVPAFGGSVTLKPNRP